MKFSTTIVFGCGGTGSHLIPNLARFRLFAGHRDPLVLIDGDKVEKGNLSRQVFDDADAGEEAFKANVACDHVLAVEPGARVRVIPRYVYGKEEFYQLLLSWKENGSKDDEVVAIFLCVDNNKSRKIVYDAVREVNVPTVVIDCGNDLSTGNVNTWVHPAPFVCPLDKWESIREPKDRAPGESCTEAAPSTPQLITANMMAAVLALHQYMVVSSITEMGGGDPIHEEIRFDLMKAEVKSIGEVA